MKKEEILSLAKEMMKKYWPHIKLQDVPKEIIEDYLEKKLDKYPIHLRSFVFDSELCFISFIIVQSLFITGYFSPSKCVKGKIRTLKQLEDRIKKNCYDEILEVLRKEFKEVIRKEFKNEE